MSSSSKAYEERISEAETSGVEGGSPNPGQQFSTRTRSPGARLTRTNYPARWKPSLVGLILRRITGAGQCKQVRSRTK
jgi:hypothetical protein